MNDGNRNRHRHDPNIRMVTTSYGFGTEGRRFLAQKRFANSSSVDAQLKFLEENLPEELLLVPPNRVIDENHGIQTGVSATGNRGSVITSQLTALNLTTKPSTSTSAQALRVESAPRTVQRNDITQNTLESTTSDTNALHSKERLVIRQLALLLHACRCQRYPEDRWCILSHCKLMKSLLSHVMSCNAGQNCEMPHCASSVQILTHWANCTRNECPVCKTFKPYPQGGSQRVLRLPDNMTIEMEAIQDPSAYLMVYEHIGTNDLPDLLQIKRQEATDEEEPKQSTSAVAEPLKEDEYHPLRTMPAKSHNEEEAIQVIYEDLLSYERIHNLSEESQPKRQKTTNEEEPTQPASATANSLKAKNNFFDAMEETLSCTICYDILYKAVSVQPCLHTFCGGCISEWLGSNNDCPTCRNDVSAIAKNHLAMKLVNLYLEAHPEAQRSENDRKRQDEKNIVDNEVVHCTL